MNNWETEERSQEENFVSEDLELKEDNILIEGESFSVMEDENENQLAISIDGLYKDKEEMTYKSRLALRENPPVLEISSSQGDYVTFVLTYGFNKELISMLNDVNKGYLGFKKTKGRIKEKEKKKKKGLIETIKNFFSESRTNFLMLAIGLALGVFVAKGMNFASAITATFGIVIMVWLHIQGNGDIKNIDTKGEQEEDGEK